MDEDTVLIGVNDCPLSSDGKHHMIRRMAEDVVESEVCVFCDRGRYFPIGKVTFDDLSTLDSPKQLEEIDSELRLRGYNEQ